jgi:hypothetical protein
MKIGVISDTHMKNSSPFLEMVVEEYFNDVDLILHAGDVTTLHVLDAFRGKEIVVVCGNRDSDEIKRRYPAKRVIEINGHRIGLIHGRGFPFGIEKRIKKSFQDLDCIVYGHTHRAVNHMLGNVLFFNPGSFSKGIASLWRRSIGILNIDNEIHGQVISL